MDSFCLIFSKKCDDVQATQNFAEYISFLKIARTTHTENIKFRNCLFLALLKFVEKPTLFNNQTELVEVDKLHQNLYERITEKPENRFEYNIQIFNNDARKKFQ